LEETTSTETITEEPVENQQPEASWHYAEGVPGQGEPPEFFKKDKYANVTEQAKAYRELEKRFGSFTGAPDNYEVKLSQELTEKGIEISTDDPLYDEAVQFAKNANMSQEGFQEMMNLYATAQIAEQEARNKYVQDEIKALGDRGQERLDNLASWGKANLSEELYAGFEAMPVNAAAVKTLEHIIGMTRGAPISSTNGNSAPAGVGDEELRQMQFEKDEYGNRRIQTDPEFRARFKKLADKVWGTHEHNIVIGR
jgi:hypothetical protein